MGRMRWGCVLMLVLLAWGTPAGCSEGFSGTVLPYTNPHERSVSGMMVPVNAMAFSSALSVDVLINGVGPHPLVVDTGAPFTAVSNGPFDAAGLLDSDVVFARMSIAGLNMRDVPVISGTLFAPASGLGGLLGADVICRYSATFDYRVRRFALGEYTATSTVAQPGTSIPFRLRGGGVLPLRGRVGFRFPATRIVLDAVIEGLPLALLVDTGASDVVLRRSRQARLIADGRPTLDLPATSASGVMVNPAVRVRSVSVAGEVVENVVVGSVADASLDRISTELGQPIDGLLGVGFLREFLVTVDYPRGVLRLQRYADRSHLVDGATRVGLFLQLHPIRVTPEYSVHSVVAGSDAELQRIPLGAVVESIDGIALSTLNAGQVEEMCTGNAGDVRVLRTSRSTYSVRVERLLP